MARRFADASPSPPGEGVFLPAGVLFRLPAKFAFKAPLLFLRFAAD
jgi:hypothetical protein